METRNMSKKSNVTNTELDVTLLWINFVFHFVLKKGKKKKFEMDFAASMSQR
jgi:hypothetical protein